MGRRRPSGCSVRRKPWPATQPSQGRLPQRLRFPSPSGIGVVASGTEPPAGAVAQASATGSPAPRAPGSPRASASRLSRPRSPGPWGAGPAFGEIPPPPKAHADPPGSEEGAHARLGEEGGAGCWGGEGGLGRSSRWRGGGEGRRALRVLGGSPGAARAGAWSTHSCPPPKPRLPCSLPAPARPALTQPRSQLTAPLPAPAASSSNSWGLRSPDSRVPAPAHPPRCRSARRRAGGRARRPRRKNLLGASPASFPQVRRAPVTAASPPASRRVPSPGLAPGVPLPRPPLLRLLPGPDSPRASRVCLRRPRPRAPRDQPRVGEVCAPGSPATHRGRGPAPALRAAPVPPARCASWRLGSALELRARRAPEPRSAGRCPVPGARGAAWRAGLRWARPADRPCPPLGARRAWGSRGSPAGCGRASAPPARASAPPRLGPPRPGPRSSTPSWPPARHRLDPFAPLQDGASRPRLETKAASEKTPARSSGFEPAAHELCDLGPANFEGPPVCKARPASWGLACRR